MKTLHIETPTHGRVLVRDAAVPDAAVVGFHGYMESADLQMERLLAISAAGRWTLISVQGLHRVYKPRSDDVVASWMTRQDRELMIADNVEYANRVLESAAPAGLAVVTVGFSQGVAMAFRCAVRSRRRTHGVVAVGGDVPPELLVDETALFPPTLLLRGARDDWYTADRMEADRRALEARGVTVHAFTYTAGHEWTTEVSSQALTFIEAVCGGAAR